MNTDAQAFYRRHGLVVERSVEGNSHYSKTMGLDLDSPPQAAAGLLMRFTKRNY